MGCACNKKEEIKIEKLVKNNTFETFMNHCCKNKRIIGLFIIIFIIIFLFIIFRDKKNNDDYLILPRGSIIGSSEEYIVDLPISEQMRLLRESLCKRYMP